MKYLIQLLSLFLLSSSAFTQCPTTTYLIPPVNGGDQITTRHIEEFGGIPDDECCDHWAFNAASKYFDAIGGNGVLILSPGEYIVGAQTFDTGLPTGYQTYRGDGSAPGCSDMVYYMHAFELENAENFTVEGNGATIRFNDCMYYGRFKLDGPIIRRALIDPAISGNCDPGSNGYSYAAIGSIFRFARCENIAIRNVVLEGNLDRVFIGGKTHGGSHNFQLTYDGIIFENTVDCKVDGVHASNFGRDGMSLVASQSNLISEVHPSATLDPHDPSQQAFIFNNQVTNSSFNSNGRTGFAWTGCAGLIMENCTFAFNAITRIQSSTFNGIDIEWHSPFPQPSNGPMPYVLRYGEFTNCRFLHNWGNSLETQDYGCQPLFDFKFKDCVFKAAESGSTIKSLLQGFYFENCDFYGKVSGLHTRRNIEPLIVGSPDTRDAQFVGCTFNETDAQFNYLPNSPNCVDLFPFWTENYGRIFFDQSTFNVECRGTLRMFGTGHLNQPGCGGPMSLINCNTNYLHFNDCTFNSEGANCGTDPNYLGIRFAKSSLTNSTLNYPGGTRAGTGAYDVPSQGWIDNSSCAQAPTELTVNTTHYEYEFDACKPQYKNPPVVMVSFDSQSLGNPIIDAAEFCYPCTEPVIYTPSEGERYLESQQLPEGRTWLVFSADGQLVMSGEGEFDPATQRLNNLSPGIYLFKRAGKPAEKFVVN